MKPIFISIIASLGLTTGVCLSMVHDYNLLQERILQLEEREVEQRSMNAKVVIKFGKLDKAFNWQSN
jgi:hypothetical protein